MAGHVSIDAIRDGRVGLGDILKLNALMDAQLAAEKKAMDKAQSKTGSMPQRPAA